jgi:hypothetical protein
MLNISHRLVVNKHDGSEGSSILVFREMFVILKYFLLLYYINIKDER